MWRMSLIPKTVSSAHVGVTSLLGLGWAALCINSRYNAEVGYGGRFAFLYSVAGQMVSGFSDILTLKIEEGELECSLSPIFRPYYHQGKQGQRR